MFLYGLVFSGCAQNLFLPMADRNSDEALKVAAIVANDNNEYTQVIALIEQMSAAYQARNDVRYLLASANASLCGLSFFSFSQSFNGVDFAVTSFFQFLLENFPNSTAQSQTYCEDAEAAYAQITTTTTADSLNRTYLGFAKVGAILNKNNNAAGDGNLFAGNIDPCSFTNADANQLYTGFIQILTNIAAAGLSVGTLNCPGGPIDCSKTDANTVTNDERLFIKNLIDAPNPGLGTGTGLDCV